MRGLYGQKRQRARHSHLCGLLLGGKSKKSTLPRFPLAVGGYLGSKSAKVAPKRQKTPFGPSMESLGARRPCRATLLRCGLTPEVALARHQ
jgi:hypothetical protein